MELYDLTRGEEVSHTEQLKNIHTEKITICNSVCLPYDLGGM